MRRSVAGVAFLTALLVPAAAHAAPPIARPNPAFVGIRLDYVNPLRSPDGTLASMPPLDPAVIVAAVADQRYLAYQLHDDLGGFVPAPLGAFALSSGGHDVIGAGPGQPELPLFAQAAGGRVSSFTFSGSGGATPPANGQQPVPGLGPPTPVPPPASGTTVPPPNQGFGGTPPSPPGTTTTTTTTPPTTGGGGGGRTTTTPPTTTTAPPPTTTTTAPPPTTTTTTTTTPTTTGGGGGGGGGGDGGGGGAGGGGDCGTPGLSIASDHATCSLSITNAAPGDSVTEVMTVTNTSGGPFTLSLKATGSQNHLWQGLRLGVWEQGTAPPNPLPPLLFWTTQFNQLATLASGESIHYEIELFLPTTAGNDDQHLAAVIDFTWRANG